MHATINDFLTVSESHILEDVNRCVLALQERDAVAEAPCTREDRRERIVAECNAVRQALQDLLTEYMDTVSLAIIFPTHSIY
jgi:hypothetical protein